MYLRFVCFIEVEVVVGGAYCHVTHVGDSVLFSRMSRLASLPLRGG